MSRNLQVIPMAEGKFVAYYRISVEKSGGLNSYGIKAQKDAVLAFLNGGNHTVLGSFEEVESGRKVKRPELTKALALCKETGATLVISRLDRLLRSVSLLCQLRDSGVRFVALDAQGVDNFTITILAAVAEKYAEDTSLRTRLGLERARKAGKTLGGPKPKEAAKASVEVRQAQAMAFAKEIAPVIEDIKLAFKDATLQQISDALNRRGYHSIWGGKFYPATVSNIINLINRS